MKKIVLPLMLVLSACSGEKASYTKEEVQVTITPDKFVIDETSAVENLMNPRTKVLDYIGQIKSFRNPRFSWTLFWEKATQKVDLSELSSEERASLLELGNMAHERQDSLAYVHYLAGQVELYLRLKQNDMIHTLLDALHNHLTHCRTILSWSIVDRLFGQFQLALEGANGEDLQIQKKHLLIQMLLMENDTTKDWKGLFGEVSLITWQNFARSIRDEGDINTLLDLIEIDKKLFPYRSDNLIAFIVPILENTKSLEKTLNVLGVSSTLNLVLQKKDILKTSSPESVTHFFELAIAKFQDKYKDIKKSEELSRALEESFQDMTKIYALLHESSLHQTNLSGVFQSFEKSWLVLESVAFLNGENSIDFFEEIRDYKDLAALMLFRLKDQRRDYVLPELSPLTNGAKGLSLSLRQLLEVLYEKDKGILSQKINSLCLKLEKLGLPINQVKAEDLKSVFESPSLGCTKLIDVKQGVDPIEVKLPIKDIHLPIFSGLIGSGASVKLEARSFRASMVDFSNPFLYPDLVEPLFSEQTAQNAAVLPVLFSIELDGALDLFKRGDRYHFLYYYVEEFPGKGPDCVVEPLPGREGGNFNVQVLQAHNSSTPVFTSQGGLGQKASLPFPGGHGVTFRVDTVNITEFLASLAPSSLGESSEQRFIDSSEMNIKELDALFQSAKRNNRREIQVFIDPQYLEIFSSKDQERILRDKAYIKDKHGLAETDDNDQALNEFLENKVLPQMVRKLKSMAQTVSGDELFPQMGSYFHIPNGDSGEVLSDGPQGKSGSFSFGEL